MFVTFVVSQHPPLSEASNIPGLAEFVKQMNAAYKAGDVDANIDDSHYSATALSAWLGMQVVEQVVKNMKDPIDAETFLAALKKSKATFGGIVPDVDFANPAVTPNGRRVFVKDVHLLEWNRDKKQLETVPGVTGDVAVALGAK